MVHIYNGILVIRRDEILPFVTTWIDLEIIMTDRKSWKSYDITYMWDINLKATN